MSAPQKKLLLLVACAALGVTQSGCVMLLSSVAFTETSDTWRPRPEENGVKLTCAGKECDSATLVANYSRGANPYVFGVGVALETGAAFAAASQANGINDKWVWIASGIGTLVFLDLMNTLSGVDHGVFTRHGSCCVLEGDVTADWKGRQVALKLDDLTERDDDAVVALPSFSVERALARAGGGKVVGAGKPGLLKQGSRLAVLDFKNSTGTLRSEDVRFLSDVVRTAALPVLPKLDVMSKETMVVALDKSLAAGQCDAECEVETGRRIGADGLVSGEVIKLGAGYKLNLFLHATKGGQLLSAGVASGASVQELEKSLQEKAGALLRER